MAQPWGLIIILLMRKCQRPEPLQYYLQGFYGLRHCRSFSYKISVYDRGGSTLAYIPGFLN